jgi:signal transduction histidine kinase
MFIPASSEFVALCQSQVAVLTQGLGATLSAVYLTQELAQGTQAKLIPVVVYPETTQLWEEGASELVLPELQSQMDALPRLSTAKPRLLPQGSDSDPSVDYSSSGWDNQFWRRQRQVVLPLMHEGAVMGLLVASREDRPWNEKELTTIERIARSLALAYIIDQRRVWSEQQINQQHRLIAQQRDRLDDLLHQLRNPLTAVRTFGKLLFKRLLPGDQNRDVASSIVRESDRLQELLKEFDATLEASERELAPLALPAASISAISSLPTAGDPGEIVPPPTSMLPATTLPLKALSVTEVLEPLIDSARVIAQERLLELYTQIPEDLPLVRGNAKGLREVFSNLLDNALKYTPQGGRIDLQVGVFPYQNQGIDAAKEPTNPGSSPHRPSLAAQPEKRLGILISDTGPGIPPQDLERLFERHYRGVQASTAIPGSGLGLAIAQELMTQMQGEIEVFSPAQSAWAKLGLTSMGENRDYSGQGTTFVVWLMLE